VPYERDILDEPLKRRNEAKPVEARIGMVVEDRMSGFCGDIVKITIEAVTLRDRKGNHRHFLWKPAGFLLEGKPVTLTRAAEQLDRGPRQSASGSVRSSERVAARTARASRIYVEGIHDAELIEHVWGDDLRETGIVVEPMHGIDDLAQLVADFGPSPTRRLGVLVDHLVAGSKEERIARTINDANVLITGHRFVDVWEAIDPRRVGLEKWPAVPRGEPWKEGMCRLIGAPEPAAFWKQLRNRVRTYADLHSDLVGSVEQLIDFVTTEP
jgi:Protein of unknown function (DUF3097)